ncbi:glycoside hydrolase family 16 protein [Granulosicoccus antarcticus]|uniref:Endo-1,3-1,4-beta-glycanase ExsH n=1 Tax=Granulosicoccus antarcticus IMCC3135 TaxID=1192854 RepID=A0A2Z2NUB8_9GAMM|nr:glycoside hydrolase family 16 protein [Granulosicoccus antarcticus]ASJ74899.1 Endo-1,3-1,4-beta-glycanase ExsH [Granulosicoccus antarcticus IMCC3135]
MLKIRSSLLAPTAALLMTLAPVMAHANARPVIAPLPDMDVQVGETVQVRVIPSDADGHVPALRLINPPSGSTFFDNRDGTRTFAWTPQTKDKGVVEITFEAADAKDSSLKTVRQLYISVVTSKETNLAPSIKPLSDQTITLGSQFDFQVIPVDPEGHVPSLRATPMPEGARFDDNRDGTRQFQWTPQTAPTTVEVTFKAIDADDRTLFNTQTVTLKVLNAPDTTPGSTSDDNNSTTTDLSYNSPPPSYSSDEQEPALGQGSNTSTETDDLVDPKVVALKTFTSHTTLGFTGELSEDSIHVSWNEDPEALGYNVYRQGKYVTTVWSNSYTEHELFDQDYYYEIQAFDQTKTIYYYVATGLTVSVTTTGRTDPSKPKSDPDLLQDYELIFADEFNGNSLDTSKWNTSFLWGDDIIINGELQHYVDIKNEPDFGYNPFSFDGESLTINSIETPSELAHKASGQPYLSGLITSYDALQFVYGYAETRAKVTFGRSYWPAFWLLNAYYGQGGDDPEIDIMEFIGHDQDVVYHTYHYYDEYGQLRSTKSEPTPGIDYTSDFHTFAVEWKPGTIIYFVDGIEVHRVTNSKVSQQSMYLIANTAMGGWWAGNPDETTPFPGKYMIDYIRVYQRVTPFDDVMLNDDMTELPYADDMPGKVVPNHRPTLEQWPAGYPYK